MVEPYLKEISNLDCFPRNSTLVGQTLDAWFHNYVQRSAIYSNGLSVYKNQGNGKKLALVSYVDEIGILTGHYLGNGFLKFSLYGTVDISGLNTQPLTIYGTRTFHGLIGIRSEYWTDLDSLNQKPDIRSLYIDTGIRDDEAHLIQIGDFGAFQANFQTLRGSMVSGKGMSGKSGSAVLMLLAQTLSTKLETYFILCDKSAQGKGALACCLRELRPDMVFHIDTIDMRKKIDLELGHGPVLTFGGTVDHHITNSLWNAAKRAEISLQTEIVNTAEDSKGTTLLSLGEGCPTAELRIPVDNFGMAQEVVNLADIECCAALIGQFVHNEFV